MMQRRSILLVLCVLGFALYHAAAQEMRSYSRMMMPAAAGDSSRPRVVPAGTETGQTLPVHVWGLDVLISNDGFGLGGFYRKEITPDIAGFVTLSVSESKDAREVERFDPYYGVSYTPGKLNRFLVIPFLAGIQYRLFREDIMDTFRPYLNIGAGPAMIYQAPFVDFVEQAPGYLAPEEIDFFKSLGRGRAHWTASAFIGAGANFGTDRTNLFGVNFRYYFTYLFSGGLPSLYNTSDAQGAFGTIAAKKKDFGGFFITLNIGMGY